MDELKKNAEKIFGSNAKYIEMANKTCAEDYTFFNVSSHEMGHCIYGLEDLGDKIPVAMRSTLEEPRADLTALFVLCEMRKLVPKEKIRHLLMVLFLTFLKRFKFILLCKFFMFFSENF